MAAKESKSLKLAAELEKEILDLKGTFIGQNLSEIITFILKDWVKNNRQFIKELRAEIAATRATQPSGGATAGDPNSKGLD